MALRFIRSEPSLIPLFAAVGTAIAGGTAFGLHYLRKNSDVVINKNQNPEPWNAISQDKNTKLFSPNSTFWASRTGLPDPRAAFIQESKNAANEKAGNALERAKEVKKRLSEASEKAGKN